MTNSSPVSTQDIPATDEQLAYLLSPRSIRARCRQIYQLAQQGQTAFRLVPGRLDECAKFVTELTQKTYPSGDIPFHSRWTHFQAGGLDRLAFLNEKLSRLSALDQLRARFDLVITSVLLDAGSGPDWKFVEHANNLTLSRSEGLAVASLRLFESGLLSSDTASPLRADAQALELLTLEKLALVFQITPENPLAGIETRLAIMNGLGRVCRRDRDRFPTPIGSTPRLGFLADFILTRARDGTLACTEILRAVLLGLGAAWPARLRVAGIPFGDVWHYDPLHGEPRFESLVPFHKLSQWLTYSLIEPLETYGLQVTGVEQLTGLPEYRNGGLFLDMGVLELRDPGQATRSYTPGSTLIIEWRALTICLLDELADRVRKALGRTEAELPLAKILQGGTWAAGRKLAEQKRPGGRPPLELKSDGSVF